MKDLVRKYQVTFLTTNWVQYESLTRLRSHGIERCRRLQDLLNKDIFSVEQVSQELEVRSVQMFWAYDDKEWSIVDCSGFALMEDRKILYAFAADHHFKQARRIPLLEQATEGIWRKSYEYLNFG